MVLDEPPEAQRLQLLNDVWKVVMKLNSPEVILRRSWMPIVFAHNLLNIPNLFPGIHIMC